MKISKITIENFLSIKSVSFTPKDYTVLIGKNNTGKSNVIEALLFFYDKIKLSSVHFYTGPNGIERELAVEVEFTDLTPEEFVNLPSKYLLDGGRLRVRRVADLDNLKSLLHGYEKNKDTEVLSEKDFFGVGEVGKAKIGDVLYIPTLKDIADELKTFGSASFAKLLKEIVTSSIRDSKEYRDFSNSIMNLSESLKGVCKSPRGERQYSCFAEIEKSLDEELADWKVKSDIRFNPLDPDKISQHLAGLVFAEEDNIYMLPEQKGHGFQRSALVALLKIWAEMERNREQEKRADMDSARRKIFRTNFVLILFEEPELLQHPHQQERLFEALRIITSQPNTQVICTTHSSAFLSESTDSLETIVRLRKEDSQTKISSVSGGLLSVIQSPEVQKHFKFHLWLNPDRNRAFFADFVILTEGIADKLLVKWLMNDDGPLSSGLDVSIIDCGGKWNIPHFMRLFRDLSIPHSVLHDEDNVRSPKHQKGNAEIQAATSEFTRAVRITPGNLENWLNIPEKIENRRKPLVILEYLSEKGLLKEKREELKILFPIITPPVEAS